MKPPMLKSSIEHVEFLLHGAKEGYQVNEWMVDFMANIIFQMQLWRTNQMGWETKGFPPAHFKEAMDAFLHIIEEELPYYRVKIKHAQDRMSNEAAQGLSEESGQ